MPIGIIMVVLMLATAASLGLIAYQLGNRPGSASAPATKLNAPVTYSVAARPAVVRNIGAVGGFLAAHRARRCGSARGGHRHAGCARRTAQLAGSPLPECRRCGDPY